MESQFPSTKKGRSFYILRDILDVSVGAAPGKIEIVLYGLDVLSVDCGGETLSLNDNQAGFVASLDGKNGVTLRLKLK